MSTRSKKQSPSSSRRADEIKSWRQDKAVQDNIVESWLCVECGVNTHPGCPDGPQTRIDIALTGKSHVKFDSDTEVYAVKASIWKEAGMRGWNGCLCIGCLELRLGRQLQPRDFSRHDDLWAQFPCTERLLNRRDSNRQDCDRRRAGRGYLWLERRPAYRWCVREVSRLAIRA